LFLRADDDDGVRQHRLNLVDSSAFGPPFTLVEATSWRI
jgi:hypothetical protein